MTAIQTTTTTSTTTSTQTGIQLTVGSQANTQQVGSYVTDVSIAPYINPTIVSFYAFNMRPNHRMHIFFDSVLVDQYCAPGIIPASTPTDTSSYTAITKNGNWGDAIYSDSSGRVAGQFSIPGSTFKTGDRNLEITDASSLALGAAAMTTISSAMFTASNLNVTKNAITLTTVNPQLSVTTIGNTIVNTTISTNTTILPDIVNIVNNVITNTQVVTIANVAFLPPAPPWNPANFDFSGAVGGDGGGGGGEPIAQALTISVPQSGVYVTSLDLFFQQKSLIVNNGVTVFLCETQNGYPNTNCILPFSTVRLPYANIATSTTANVSTNFLFEAPVFLSNNKDYAFVVKPDGNDPDYVVYTANIGDIDITTGYQVFSQPLVGTAFYGATTKQWTALQTEYIKFNLRRATFNAPQGDAYFYNSNTDYINISGLVYANTSASLMPGDYVYGATTNATATANASKLSTLQFYDNVRNILYVEDSTGAYANGGEIVQIHRFVNTSVMTPNSSTLVAYANSTSLYNPVVDALVPQVAAIAPSGTLLNWDYIGTSNTYVVDTTAQAVAPGNDNEFRDKERIIASLSNEVTGMASAKSFRLHANLTTTTSWLSPLIDTVRNQELVIANKIDPVSFNYNEFYNYANSQSKYVSRVVTLAQGQDAEDIQVSLTAHRPPGTDVTVWVKFLNGQDADSISLKTWTPLINQGASVYSDPSNPRDFKELNFIMPARFSAFNTTGTITANSTYANVVGIGTTFGTDVKVGYWLNMAPNSTFTESSRQVVSITNATFLTLNAPFAATAGYTANAFYVVVPPTTAYRSSNTQTQLTGTVATSTTNNTIIGTGTAFTTQVVPGSIIACANDAQVVVSVTNATHLVVGTPWSSTVTSTNVYAQSPTGVTYLNSNNALYNTYKQFQLKIVLQSNDACKVPFLDDLRVLALQL